jgi:glycosyltransferase involved in cell wall biosynthesis
MKKISAEKTVVAFCIRADYKSAPGGDTVQLENTISSIQKNHNFLCQIITDCDEISEKFDVVHIFNIQNPAEALKFAKKAKEYRCAIALSTIYWDLHDSLSVQILTNLVYYLGLDHLPRFFRLGKYFFNTIFYFSHILNQKPYYLSKNYVRDVKETLMLVDVLLPNSHEEYKIIENQFGFSKPYFSVVNAVDVNSELVVDSEKSGVIIVGRVEPTKNQLNLLKATKNLKLSPTIIGRLNDEKYANIIRRYYGFMIKDDFGLQKTQSQVMHLLCTHRVHVLPSFRESPGLSSLEALLSGCNIVISNHKFCPVNTYFYDLIDQHVFLCDPYDYFSIMAALKKALIAKLPNVELLERLRKKFSWDEAATQTIRAYQELIFG